MKLLKNSLRKSIRHIEQKRGIVLSRKRYWPLSGLLAWFLTVSISSASPALLPEPFSADYQGRKYIVVTARAKLKLAREGGYFKYTMESKVKAPFYKNKLYDCSVMRIVDGGVVPIEHRHAETKLTEYNVRTVFDWDAKIATVKFDNEDDIVSMSLEQATWDLMSVQLQLMIDAMREKVRSGGTYTIIENGEKGSFDMALLGEEVIDSVLGDVNTLKIGSPSSDHENRFWLAPDHGYIPLRMEISGVRIELDSDVKTTASSANNESSIDNSGAIPGCLEWE